MARWKMVAQDKQMWGLNSFWDQISKIWQLMGENVKRYPLFRLVMELQEILLASLYRQGDGDYTWLRGGSHGPSTSDVSAAPRRKVGCAEDASREAVNLNRQGLPLARTSSKAILSLSFWTVCSFLKKQPRKYLSLRRHNNLTFL